jgi:anti-anti-sigma factor
VALDLQTTEEHGVTVVAAAGSIDSKTSPDLEKALVKLLGEKKREIVLDLARLDYVASAGLRVFVMVGKRLQAEKGRLALCAVNPSVMKVLEVSGFATLFAIRPSRQEAIDWLASGAKLSRVSSLAGEILRKDAPGPGTRAAGIADSAKSSYAADLLGGDEKKKRKS